MENECTFPGCDKPGRYAKRTLCQAHYVQQKKGQELRPLQRRTHGMPVKDRFMLYVEKSGGCWEWVGRKHCKGYGHFTWHDGREINAHRASYMLFKGEIPEDMTVDHICQRVGCVNPAHLRLATWTQQAQYKRRYNTTTKTGIRNVTKAGNGRNGYVVLVRKNGELHYGGYFMDIHEADIAAGKLRAELFDFKEKPIE